MEVFKLFESTMANVQPGHINIKDLRRDQLLDNYDAAVRTLQTLIKAKESEIAYRQDLITMLDKSKLIYDQKLAKAKEDYELAKKHAPTTLDLKISNNRKEYRIEDYPGSTTPPLPPPTLSQQSTSSSSSVASFANTSNTLKTTSMTPPIPTLPPTSSSSSASANSLAQHSNSASQQQQTLNKSLDEFNIPLPSTDNHENRSSLDRRLSEFLKTFPNLTQAGLAPPASNDTVKPLPGYYTQQPPPPPPPMGTAPPLMAMMRFPPPNMLTTQPPPLPNPASVIQHPMNHHHHQHHHPHDNHDTAADMDLSDYEDGGASGGIPPMVASAMQQGAGGKQHTTTPPHSFVAGQQFNNPIQYAPRVLNTLPFDPSIMDTGLRDSPSASGGTSRDARTGHRHSGSSGSGSGSGSKHSSSKQPRYSSSSSTSSHSSSNRSKRR